MPHANLTITLIRRNNFSDLRLRGATPRRVVQPRHVQAADSARVTPGIEAPRRDWPHTDTFTRTFWPHDQPAGPEQNPDNKNLAMPVPVMPMVPGSNSDELARRIDLYI